MKSSVAIISCLTLSLGAYAAPTGAGDDRRVQEAYNNLVAYNPEPALGQLAGPLTEALRAGDWPRASRYLLLCAFAFRLQDNPAAAAQCARLAMQLDRNNTLAVSMRVDYLLQLGRFDEAMTLLAKTKSLPDSIPSSLLEAHRAIAEGKPGLSRDILLSAAQTNRTHPVITVRLAGAYLACGDKASAAAWFRQAAEGAPHLYQKQMMLAKAFNAEGNWTEAKKHLEVAGQILPDDPFWHLTLAVILASEGNAGADAHFKAAINGSRPSVSAMVKYALYQAHQKGNFRLAHYLLDQALAMKPSSAQARQARGLIFRMQGKQEDAMAELQKAVDLNPSNSNAFAELAASPAIEKDQKKLEALALRWTAVCPYSAAAWKTLGKCRYQSQDFAAAKAAYERAGLQLNEWKAEPNWELTRCLVQAGLAACFFEEKKMPEAIEQAKLFNQYKSAPPLHAGLPVRPEKVDFARLAKDSRELKAAEHAVLADALYECGNLTGAAKEYEEALAFEPDNIIWHSSLLKVYIDKKDFVGAARQDAVVSQHMMTKLPKLFEGFGSSKSLGTP